MSSSQALPLAVLGDKKSLSKEAQLEIDRLSKRHPFQFFAQLFMAWAVIIASIWLAVELQSAWMNILAIFIVATRQNILGLLVHEQAHCLGFKASYGDSLVNFLAAYPLIVLTVEGYSQVHLSHHRYFMTEQDPDLLRKSGKDWMFPMKAGHLGKLFLTDLLGLNLWQLIKGKKLDADFPLFKRPTCLPAWVRPAYYVFAAIIFTFTNSWDIFLLYWLVPLLTILQVIVRWGAICEHQYIPNATVAGCSPIIILQWWEKLLFPNLNFTLHPYHHYFPGIPFSSLPKVHEIFLREGLINEHNVFQGNLSYLKFLIKNQKDNEKMIRSPGNMS